MVFHSPTLAKERGGRTRCGGGGIKEGSQGEATKPSREGETFSNLVTRIVESTEREIAFTSRWWVVVVWPENDDGVQVLVSI